MEINAKDVMRLRAETDAPVMECRAALVEAGGDFEKAKQILREKGKAAAAKRSDRATGEGIAAVSRSEDGKTMGVIVLECETDFVARNEDFIKMSEQIATMVRDAGSVPEDPHELTHGGVSVKALIEEAVGKIRENIKVAKAAVIKTEKTLASYVHHDKKKAVIVEIEGGDGSAEVGRQLAIQSVAFPPEYVSRDQVPQSMIDAELETETQRAINEGKAPDIAKNIAMGRINKEFMKRVVLLEQPFYKDNNISVAQFVETESKTVGTPIKVLSVHRFVVGE
ncbi:MAG TPA: translation elongation factor Ts [Fimbriimonadaceae bacterium]|nr:translation elongation factor Ts [Fimbriimonadaceae bacterium]